MYCTKCGSSIPNDVKFCPECGEDLGKIKTLLKEPPAFLDEKKEEILQLIQKKDFASTVRVLEEVLNKLTQEEIRFFYEFFKEILLIHPQLFESKKFYRGYLKNLTRILSDNQLKEMETYLIDQLCTYEDEKVGVATIGKLFYFDLIFSGRIYITEFRIIVIGTRNKNWEMITSPAAWSAANPLIRQKGVLNIVIDSATQRRKIGRILREKGKIKRKVKIGYQFPIKESFVNLENDKIIFTSFITDYGETIKIAHILVPVPYTRETNEEYLERVKNILEKIRELKRTKVIRAFQPSKFKPIKY